MPTLFQKHVFVTEPHRALRARDVRYVRCEACGKQVRLPMRTKEPTENLLASALRHDKSECSGPKKEPTPESRPNLMGAVTEAVLRAEGAIKDALFFYDVLVKAEQAIVDSPDTDELDKEIAQRGVENATRILVSLQALWIEEKRTREPEPAQGIVP